jgi:CheY-like chemotaxis protein
MASPLHVLVVDDNDVVRRLLVFILEGAGFVSIGVESGEAALEAARAAPPDLCIVDEVMPRMRGTELIRALRSAAEPRLASIPVIGISGRAGAAEDLLAAGADAFVAKPVEERTLLPAVARVLFDGPRSASPEDRPAP